MNEHIYHHLTQIRYYHHKVIVSHRHAYVIRETYFKSLEYTQYNISSCQYKLESMILNLIIAEK